MKRKLETALLALVMLTGGAAASAAGTVNYSRYDPNMPSHFDVKENVAYLGNAASMWGVIGSVDGTPDEMCAQLASYRTNAASRFTYVPSSGRNFYLVSFEGRQTRLSCTMTREDLKYGNGSSELTENLIHITGLKP